MTRTVVDTNVLVSFLTDRDPEQQERAALLFAAAARGEERLILHQLVLAELVYVLTNIYRVSTAKASAILREILRTPGVEVEDSLSWSALCEVWPGEIPDFADAALFVVCRQRKLGRVATFDRQFSQRLRRRGIEIRG